MELPIELVTILTTLIGGYVTFLIVEGIKAIVEGLGGNMDGVFGKIAKIVSAAIAGATVAVVIGVANALLGLVPPALVPIVGAILNWLIVVLSANGVYRLYKKSKAVVSID